MVTNLSTPAVNLVVENSALYIETTVNGQSDGQLWKSDGPAAGTVMVATNVEVSQPIASLVGQLTQPTVTSGTASPQTGAFGVGHEITLTVGFSEGVTVSGNPTLLLNDGRTATFDAAATAALKEPTKAVFDYTVGAGQNTTELAITGLNGGNIADSAGNPDDLSSLPTAFNGLLIDTTPPSVTISSEVLTGDDGQLTLTGTISDNIDTPTITIFDGTTSLGTATINGTNWTFATTLSQGSHQLSAHAVDQAGNTAAVNAPQSVTVNDVATAPSLSGPSSVSWTKGAASVPLPIGVVGGDADDLATTTVTIKGLRNSATITDNLDSTVFSSSTATLTAAEVNSGLTFHPGRLTSGTLTVTAGMTESGGSATSAPLTVSLTDPPLRRSHQDFHHSLHGGFHAEDLIWTDDRPPAVARGSPASSDGMRAADILFPGTALLGSDFATLVADDRAGKLTADGPDMPAATLFSRSPTQ
jgi:hypothetical protein